MEHLFAAARMPARLEAPVMKLSTPVNVATPVKTLRSAQIPMVDHSVSVPTTATRESTATS